MKLSAILTGPTDVPVKVSLSQYKVGRRKVPHSISHIQEVMVINQPTTYLTEQLSPKGKTKLMI